MRAVQATPPAVLCRLLLVPFITTNLVVGLDNGLGLSGPAMGWSSCACTVPLLLPALAALSWRLINPDR
eukprot:SAG31_NODE_21020_length_559_cov_1.343478_1_plen_68_part_10